MDTNACSGVRVTSYRWMRERDIVRLLRSDVGSFVFVDDQERGVIIPSGQVLSVPDGFVRFVALVGFREVPAATVVYEIVRTKRFLGDERTEWITWENAGSTHRVLLSDIALGTQFATGYDWRHERA